MLLYFLTFAALTVKTNCQSVVAGFSALPSTSDQTSYGLYGPRRALSITDATANFLSGITGTTGRMQIVFPDQTVNHGDTISLTRFKKEPYAFNFPCKFTPTGSSNYQMYTIVVSDFDAATAVATPSNPTVWSAYNYQCTLGFCPTTTVTPAVSFSPAADSTPWTNFATTGWTYSTLALPATYSTYSMPLVNPVTTQLSSILNSDDLSALSTSTQTASTLAAAAYPRLTITAINGNTATVSIRQPDATTAVASLTPGTQLQYGKISSALKTRQRYQIVFNKQFSTTEAASLQTLVNQLKTSSPSLVGTFTYDSIDAGATNKIVYFWDTTNNANPAGDQASAVTGASGLAQNAVIPYSFRNTVNGNGVSATTTDTTITYTMNEFVATGSAAVYLAAYVAAVQAADPTIPVTAAAITGVATTDPRTAVATIAAATWSALSTAQKTTLTNSIRTLTIPSLIVATAPVAAATGAISEWTITTDRSLPTALVTATAVKAALTLTGTFGRTTDPVPVNALPAGAVNARTNTYTIQTTTSGDETLMGTAGTFTAAADRFTLAIATPGLTSTGTTQVTRESHRMVALAYEQNINTAPTAGPATTDTPTTWSTTQTTANTLANGAPVAAMMFYVQRTT